MRASTVRQVHEDAFPEAPEEPIWSGWWLLVIVAFVGLGLIGFLTAGDDDGGEEAQAVPTTQPAPTTTIGSPPTTAAPTSTTTTTLG